MADYRLLIKRSAAKELNQIGEAPGRRRLVERIRKLSSDPRPFGSEKLSGREELYRVRSGRYRIVYTVDDASATVTIVKIGHRKDVYRR